MEGTENRVKPVNLYCVVNTPKDVNENLAPIIFIPGLFSTNRTFVGVKYEIAERTKRKVYTLELRNHGRSDWSEHFSMQHLLADLENFMKTKGISRAVLAGHSMGGKTAIAMALKHPEKVEKLIVEDIPLTFGEEQIKQIKKFCLVNKLLQMKLRQLPKHFTDKQAQAKMIPYMEKFFPVHIQNLNSHHSQYVLPFYKTKNGEFEWEMNIDVIAERISNDPGCLEIDLSSNPVYPGKVLIMAGEKSLMRVQDDLSDFRKHFSQFECRIIENGFHTYHAEDPSLYANLVFKFICEETS